MSEHDPDYKAIKTLRSMALIYMDRGKTEKSFGVVSSCQRNRNRLNNIVEMSTWHSEYDEKEA